MDFEEAIKAAKSGSQVRRSSWRQDRFAEIRHVSDYWYWRVYPTWKVYPVITNELPWEPSKEDQEAEDWEIKE